MADEITNKMLLEHMQAMKYDLTQQITQLGQKVEGHDARFDALTLEVRQGFEEARQHREALQEDLETTMRVQQKHSIKLARL